MFQHSRTAFGEINRNRLNEKKNFFVRFSVRTVAPRPYYGRPTGVVRPVPAPAGGAGAGALGAALGALGGTLGCLLCLSAIGALGLFACVVALTAYTSKSNEKENK